MRVEARNLGKKFNRHWIFRNLNITAEIGDLIAITGHNGSGKSTLIKILSGFISPSEGAVDYGHQIENPQLTFNFAGPYLNLLEEFTLLEHLEFHSKFKKPTHSFIEMVDESGLSGAENKLVKDFSSGMKQRLRLLLAFFFEGEIIFLDEPTSNLDESGSQWYQKLLIDHREGHLIFVASNQPSEYQSASQVISVEKQRTEK